MLKYPSPSIGSLERYSLYKLNRIGDKQYPCLIPLPVCTILVSPRSSRTLTLWPIHNLVINFLSRQSIPLIFRICINLVQFTRSNAFCQSMKQIHSSKAIIVTSVKSLGQSPVSYMTLISFVSIFKPPSHNNLSTSPGTSSSPVDFLFLISLIAFCTSLFKIYGRSLNTTATMQVEEVCPMIIDAILSKGGPLHRAVLCTGGLHAVLKICVWLFSYNDQWFPAWVQTRVWRFSGKYGVKRFISSVNIRSSTLPKKLCFEWQNRSYL
jgi:hypothetical protein